MSNQDDQDKEQESQNPQEDVAKNPGDDEEAEPGTERALDTDFEAAIQWRIAKSLETLRGQINAMAPNRSKASDGGIGNAEHAARNSDHNPWVDLRNNKGVVTARDFTHDPAGGCDAGALAEKIRESRDPRVKYIIWMRRIANSSPIGGEPAWAWRPYSGKNPHNHHVHISVLPDISKYDSEDPWTIQ
jgi:endonuclease G, mitochondrial